MGVNFKNMGHLINASDAAYDALLTACLHPPHLTRVLGTGPLWGCVVLGAQAHGSQPRCASWHRQELFTLNIVLRGSGTFRDSAGQTHALIPGSVYQRLQPGSTRARVTIDPASDCLECFVLLDHATFRALHLLQIIPRQELLQSGTPALLARDYLDFRDLCLRPHDEVSRRRLLAGLAAWLGTIYDRALQPAHDGFWEHLVEQAGLRLESSLSDKLHLPDLARDLHVSYPSLRRAFRRIKGLPLAEYRIRKRIDAACRMLGTHPVKEVARLLGYCDPFTFSAQFRKITGTPPSAFRRALAQGSHPHPQNQQAHSQQKPHGKRRHRQSPPRPGRR